MKLTYTIVFLLLLAGCGDSKKPTTETPQPATSAPPALNLEPIRSAIEVAINKDWEPTGNAAPPYLTIDTVWPLADTPNHYVARERWWPDAAPDGCLLLARMQGDTAEILCGFASDQYCYPVSVSTSPSSFSDGVLIEIVRSTRRGAHWFEVYEFTGDEVRELFSGKSRSPEIDPPLTAFVHENGRLCLRLQYRDGFSFQTQFFPWDPASHTFQSS